MPIKYITREALSKLKEHDWPGNIRELENVIHRAVLLSEGEITQNDVVLSAMQQKQQPNTDDNLMSNIIKGYLGDANFAANLLGISISDLKRKLDNESKS
jgi:DNA-binding NtrC family response regulator